MDHFVQSHRQKGELTHWVSVNLDGFDPINEETRLINRKELPEAILGALALAAHPQVVVSATDLPLRLQNWVYRTEKREGQEGYLSAIGNETAEITEGDVNPRSLNSIERKMLTLWRNYFGKPGITVDDDFFEIGGDSLKALTMIGRVQKVFNTDVPIREFFNSSTVKQLSEYVQKTKEAEAAGPSSEIIKETIEVQ
jgi:acyl carrier protein